jgi:hypothetical protein
MKTSEIENLEVLASCFHLQGLFKGENKMKDLVWQRDPESRTATGVDLLRATEKENIEQE